MTKLAFMTIGLLKAPYGDPQVQGFIDRIEAILATATASDGYLGYLNKDEHLSVEELTLPQGFRKEDYAERGAATLSLWQDIESVFAFAYNGLHAEALSKRREWTPETDFPVYVAWWVSDDHTPSWSEACGRYDKLRQENASPDAFDFKHPFASDGQPIKLNREMIKAKAAQYTTTG